MPAHCCAFGCKSRQIAGFDGKFFRIPKDEHLRQKWVAAIKRDGWEPTEHTRICSKHFISGQPSREPTNPDFVPSIFSFNNVPDTVLKKKVERHQRLLERKENISKTESVHALLSLGHDLHNIDVPGTATQTPVPVLCEAAVQTDISLPVMESLIITNQFLKGLSDKNSETILDLKHQTECVQRKCDQQYKDMDDLKNSIQKLEDENKVLVEEIDRKTLSFGRLENNDGRTKFYTGLPNFETLKAVFDAASTKVKRKGTKLKKEDELLVTLVKLRRNLAMKDLSYRFNVSQSLVTNIFHVWLDALYQSLGGIIKWPESDVCQLPQVFQNEIFRKVKCIIDCTEIFIERPSNLKARAQTYSNYKRHNTIKILVGVSPTGCVTFLSKCWGGRVSDRRITCDSGFLDKLLPGDVVLADRGFNMNEDFALKRAKLLVPSFTKGKKQLSKEELETSRTMSRARIHIERVIGRLKDFEIIKGPLPINLVKKQLDNGDITSSDKIMRVVASFVNLNDAIL